MTILEDAEHDLEFAEIWSFHLIDGTHIISELSYNPEEVDQDIVTMCGPIRVFAENRPEGEEVYSMLYDATTYDDDFDIPFMNILAQPKPVSNFYRTFYCKSLVFGFIKQQRMELNNLELDPEEMKDAIREIEGNIADYVGYLSDRYGIDLVPEEVKTDAIKPTNKILH
jgi:hypothetical protein